LPATLPTLLNARLSRYAIAVGAVAAAMPTQAAPITVILPTPVDLSIANSLTFDVDQDGLSDLGFLLFSGGRFFAPPSRSANFGVSGNAARQLTEGVLIDIANTNSFWGTVAALSLNSAVSPTFLAIHFGSGASAPQRVAFAQFSGSTLYGFAWDEANTITTFDITAPATGIPEPATGALTALALGAVALAARKRKQA
jgi:hypothetical protein